MALNKLFWPDLGAINTVSQALKGDNIVLGTSDTVIGLLAPVTFSGFDQLNRIKERTGKPYIVLIHDNKKVNKFASLQYENSVERLMRHCWPGPLTLILNVHPAAPDFIKSSENTIALRVPDHAPLRAVLKNFDGLFSTSANKAGQSVPRSFDEVDPDILNQVSYVVLDRDREPELLPSTILDCTGKTIKVVREGAYPITQLEKVAGVSFEK